MHAILTVCQVHVLIALEHRKSTVIFAQPEGKATNLTPKSLSICTYMYVCSSQSPRSCPRYHISSYYCVTDCDIYPSQSVTDTSLMALKSIKVGQCAIFCPQSPSKSLRCTRMPGKMVSVTQKGSGNMGLVVAKTLGSENPLIALLQNALAFYTKYIIMAL